MTLFQTLGFGSILLGGALFSSQAAKADTPSAENNETPAASVGYKKGFFISDGGVNKLVIQARLQSRFAFESEDQGDNRSAKSAFSIPRARLTFKGSAYTKRLSYKFQSDFGKGFVNLKDFFIDYRVGNGEIRLRTGQFKKAFSRQQITSSSKLEFVDRSIVDKAFGNGRDIGVEIHNNLSKSPSVEWSLGVFNGSGDKAKFSGSVSVDPTTNEGSVSGGKFSNVPKDIRPATVARVGFNQGIKGYSEADLEGGPLRYAFAAAAMMHFSGGDSNTDATARAGIDFAIKSQGLSLSGGVYAAEEGADEGALSYTQMGAVAQVGYVINQKWQPVFRYAMISQTSGDLAQEIAGGLSVYNNGHGFKLQVDTTALLKSTDTTDTTDIRLRAQLQMSF